MKQPKDFKRAKELKHPKQGRDTSYVSLHQIPNKDLHFSTMRHLNNPTFPFSSISTLRYLYIPTFGRQVIRGKHFHSSAIKANRVGRFISATGHLNSSTFRSAGTSREVGHLYVSLYYLRELRKFLIDNSEYLSLHSIFQSDFDDVSSIYNYVIFTSKKCMYNAQISTLNLKSAERILAMIICTCLLC